MKIIITLVLTTLLASGASAHSKVNTTTPPNNSILANVPTQIEFGFANKIRLTKVEVSHDTNPAVAIEIGGQTGFEQMYTMPLQDFGNGSYFVRWRGLGMDGHAVQGEFSFEVN